MTATQETTAKAKASGSVRVRQFDADRHDQSLELDDALEAKPTDRQLLWIDIADKIGDSNIRCCKLFAVTLRTMNPLYRSFIA